MDKAEDEEYQEEEEEDEEDEEEEEDEKRWEKIYDSHFQFGPNDIANRTNRDKAEEEKLFGARVLQVQEQPRRLLPELLPPPPPPSSRRESPRRACTAVAVRPAPKATGTGRSTRGPPNFLGGSDGDYLK